MLVFGLLALAVHMDSMHFNPFPICEESFAWDEEMRKHVAEYHGDTENQKQMTLIMNMKMGIKLMMVSLVQVLLLKINFKFSAFLPNCPQSSMNNL